MAVTCGVAIDQPRMFIHRQVAGHPPSLRAL
jgi:hypothetical protein